MSNEQKNRICGLTKNSAMKNDGAPTHVKVTVQKLKASARLVTRKKKPGSKAKNASFLGDHEIQFKHKQEDGKEHIFSFFSRSKDTAALAEQLAIQLDTSHLLNLIETCTKQLRLIEADRKGIQAEQ